jgi:hypothetical protein
VNYQSKKDSIIQAIQPSTSSFNIFASYSTKDIEKIKPILHQISQIQGVRIFFADANLQPGDIISQRITQNIIGADIFLVFYSESAKESSYVQQEIGVALGQNKIIIPLLLDQTKPTGMLADRHYLDLSDEKKRLLDFGRLNNFIVNNIQNKNQRQLWSALAVLGIGALLLSANQNPDEDDEYY